MGGLRDAAIAAVSTAAGAYILSKTGSPELSNVAQDFTGDFLYLGVGALMGVLTFVRKIAMNKLAE
jgi:hypothetical protein